MLLPSFAMQNPPPSRREAKEKPRRNRKIRLGAKIFCERITLFSYIIVRNGVRTGVIVPIRSLAYRIPLFLRATILDAREAIAISERIPADSRYTIEDHHARQIITIIESILVYLIAFALIVIRKR